MFSFLTRIEKEYENMPDDPHTPEAVDAHVQHLTDTILEAFHKQGKMVPANSHCQKLWWDQDHLGPILINRNRARKWMLLSQLPQARTCYLEWQAYFRQQVTILKQHHWKKFVASCTDSMTYKAFSYTKPPSSAEFLPLYRTDKSLATYKPEKAMLLFEGTSIARTTADLSDITDFGVDDLIDPELSPPPPITLHEVERTVKNLPNKKAKGPDDIANELIKIALPAISNVLVQIFNACIKLSHFPSHWKTATTAILRKQDKPDYSEPGAYRPIALLSCLGKVLETIISKRITYWAETANVIAPGHMGGRRF